MDTLTLTKYIYDYTRVLETCVTIMVNDRKTAFWVVVGKQQLGSVHSPSINVGKKQVTPVTSDRNVGVICK